MVTKRYSPYIKDMAACIVNSIVDNSFFSKVQDDKTHVEMHVIKDEAAVLDRILADNGKRNRDEKSHKECKSINSGFASLDEACFNIEECVISASEDIAAWVDSARNGYKESFSIELPSEQDYEPVGTGYVVSRETNTIAEYQTQSVRIVLRKDDEASLGFTLLTAYPDVVSEDCRIPTGRDLRDITKRTKTYQEASPVSQAYMMYQTSPNQPYLVTFKAGYYGNTHDDVMSIHMPYTTKKGEQCKHIIRVKEDSIEFSTSQLMDVHVAKNFEGKRDKIIPPTEPIEKYGRYTIVPDKKFIKIDSYFTRHFNTGENDKKRKSVDLRRDDVFADFQKRFPEAAALIADTRADIIKRTGFQMTEDNTATRITESVSLNDSLLPTCLDGDGNDGVSNNYDNAIGM